MSSVLDAAYCFEVVITQNCLYVLLSVRVPGGGPLAPSLWNERLGRPNFSRTEGTLIEMAPASRAKRRWTYAQHPVRMGGEVAVVKDWDKRGRRGHRGEEGAGSKEED